jgi:putative membrane protein
MMGHMFGGGYMFNYFLCFLFLIGLLLLIGFSFFKKNNGKRIDNSSLKILKDRYAKGEIGKEEYEERKLVLLKG